MVAVSEGVQVTESRWDRRPGWMRRSAMLLTAVKDRLTHNKRNIEATLRAVKERAEES